jgi:tetratricopeptide (TPR) repeat protein
MLRSTSFALAIVCWCAQAQAASEQDRRDCAANQNQDARIAACTRVLDDASSPQALRTIAHRSRGSAYLGKRLFELAVLEFDEALKLSPQDLPALWGRARALAHQGQYDRAIADFTEMLRLNPRGDRALNERGRVHLHKSDLVAAQADFDAAILANPRNVHAHNNRGLVLARQHKLDEAIAGYAAALRIDPEYLLAYTNRARAYEAKGEFELALADYKQAAEREGLSKHDEDARAKAEAKKQLASLTKAIAEGKIGPKAAAEKRVALVVGNSAYQRVTGLRNPANDAKALAAALRRIGFSEVRELLDANLSQLGTALKEFGDLATGADWAVIYFAGHGVEVGGTNYLIPVDAALEQQSHIDDETVPLSRVLAKVAGASKMQLVILDACRNNPFVPKMRQAGKQARAIGRGLASIEPESGVLVAYAARDGTMALDGESENSPYAEALVKHLAEPGLEISLLFRKVRDEVLGKTARQQEPYTYGSLPAQPFYFKR